MLLPREIINIIYSFDDNQYIKKLHKLCVKEICNEFKNKFKDIVIYEDYFMNLKNYKLPNDVNNYNLTIEKFSQKLILGYNIIFYRERVSVTLYKITLSKRIPNYFNMVKYLILKYIYYYLPKSYYIRN